MRAVTSWIGSWPILDSVKLSRLAPPLFSSLPYILAQIRHCETISHDAGALELPLIWASALEMTRMEL